MQKTTYTFKAVQNGKELASRDFTFKGLVDFTAITPDLKKEIALLIKDKKEVQTALESLLEDGEFSQGKLNLSFNPS